VWVQAEDHPVDCPPEQSNCSTRASARTGAVIAWALAAGAAGYGTYRIVKPNQTVTKTETHGMEREEGAAKACDVKLSDLPVELRLGSRTLASAATDANGHANLAVSAVGLPALDSAGKGTLVVNGTAAAELDLHPLYASLGVGAEGVKVEEQLTRPGPVSNDAPAATAETALTVGQLVFTEWGGGWYWARVITAGRGRARIHYVGWEPSWDEDVSWSRLRLAGAEAHAVPETSAVAPLTSSFGSSAPAAFSLRGSIYPLAQGTSRLPDFARSSAVGEVYASRLDITPRSYTEGFPGITNRYEWFGIDYKGTLGIQRAGRYRFRLTSDDGARLSIDGKRIIDNDGLHAPSSKDGEVNLGVGAHDVRVEYFQGPADQIALVLEMSAGEEPFRVLDTTRYAPAQISQSDADSVRITVGESVLFDADKAQLKPQAERVLREIKTSIVDAGKFTAVNIEGHTDDRGSDQHNLDLSQRRAAAVARFLTQNGVPNGSVYTQAFGESRPRVLNTDDENRAKNRRVEIVLSRATRAAAPVPHSAVVPPR
jgi:outer membrane protein OmpA-like peptidoglycan-associated protein